MCNFFILKEECKPNLTFRLYEINNNSVLNRLERCFDIINNKKVKMYPNRIGDIINALKVGNRLETEYFKLKLFKNGNIHVCIKDEKTLDKFNMYSANGINKIGCDIKIQK